MWQTEDENDKNMWKGNDSIGNVVWHVVWRPSEGDALYRRWGKRRLKLDGHDYYYYCFIINNET